MQSFRITWCFICNDSVLCSALYANHYYVVYDGHLAMSQPVADILPMLDTMYAAKLNVVCTFSACVAYKALHITMNIAQ